MKKIKWGVLGIATIARNAVIPAIENSENSELYAIASRDAAKAAGYASRCRKVYSSYEEMLDDPDVEAVYIPLPNHLHCEWTVKALNKGKHVLCEKPLAMTYDECVKMAGAAKANNRLVTEAFMYRYSEKMRIVADIVKSGQLGDIQYIHSEYGFDINDPKNVRLRRQTGGGSLFDMGCYPVNFINFIAKLTGTQLASTHAYFVTRQDMDGAYVDVRCNGMLNYDNGMTCTVCSWLDSSPWHDTVVVGRDKILVIPYAYSDDPVPMTLVRYAYEKDPRCQGRELMFIDDKFMEKETILAPQCDRYCMEISEFSSAVLDNRSPSYTIEESLQNMKTIETLYSWMVPNEKSRAKPRF